MGVYFHGKAAETGTDTFMPADWLKQASDLGHALASSSLERLQQDTIFQYEWSHLDHAPHASFGSGGAGGAFVSSDAKGSSDVLDYVSSDANGSSDVLDYVSSDANGSSDVLNYKHGSSNVLDYKHGSSDVLDYKHGSSDVLDYKHGSSDVLDDKHGTIKNRSDGDIRASHFPTRRILDSETRPTLSDPEGHEPVLRGASRQLRPVGNNMLRKSRLRRIRP